MSIGDDIKSVFAELAEEIQVYNHVSGEVTSTEFVDFERDWQPRSAFESEHIISATFPYDTAATVGDRIDFQTTGSKYLLATSAPNIFERNVISKNTILYKCNNQVVIKRKSEEPTRNSNYELVHDWNEIHSGEHVLYTGRLAYQETINTDQFARVTKRSKRLYASMDLDVQPKDCVYVDNEIFEVELVEKNHYPGLSICSLLDYVGEQ